MEFIASVGVLILVNHSTLLLQHRDMRPDIFYPGKIGLFGGAIENNETPQSAAVREIKEELFIDIINPRLMSILNLDVIDKYLLRRRYFYIADIDKKIESEIDLREGQGIVRLKHGKNIKCERFVPYDLAFLLTYLHDYR